VGKVVAISWGIVCLGRRALCAASFGFSEDSRGKADEVEWREHGLLYTVGHQGARASFSGMTGLMSNDRR
jgi:hypothetical protein